jgi:DNA-binding cell septation regulator SpoVG
MSKAIVVTEVQFHAAQARDYEQGLAGWVSLTLDGRLRLSSVAVRRTLDGRLALSFPARRDGADRQRFYFRPLDDRTRREIERQVFQAIGLEYVNQR